MNWILETYSDVYSTAMMRHMKHSAMIAKPGKTRSLAQILKLFGRGR
jgi:hypothetical protein